MFNPSYANNSTYCSAKSRFFSEEGFIARSGFANCEKGAADAVGHCTHCRNPVSCAARMSLKAWLNKGEVTATARSLYALIKTEVLVLLAVFLVQGCVTTGNYPGNFGTADSGLDRWVDQTLAPYLVDQLSRQPRFKGEPVLLVSMNGADVRPDIDELTHNVRSRLLDRLLHTPGTDLVWRPTAQPWEHHRRADRLRCNTASTARYFVGIDVAPSTSGKYQVSVRALDIGAATWVTGFGKTWRGGLTLSQRQALGARRTDEYLRGLRLLPFSAGETDLVAVYLARNLSCLLREQGAADYRVYVDTTAKNEPELRKVLTLVSHNLARQQAVRVTENRQRAELILGGSLSELQGSLHQLWVKLRARSTDVSPTSLDTDAYIYLGQPADNPLVVASIGPISLPRPSYSQPAALLSKLRVLTALETRGCAGGGVHTLSSHETLGRGECFQIEFDLYQPAHLFVLNHAVNGSLTRMHPSGCQAQTEAWQQLVPRHSVRIAGQGSSTFRWARQPGIESVYAIAVKDSGIARELALHLNDLPDGCALPGGNSAPAEQYQAWLTQLDMLLDRYSGSVDWQAVRVRHAQP